MVSLSFALITNQKYKKQEQGGGEGEVGEKEGEEEVEEAAAAEEVREGDGAEVGAARKQAK